MYYLFSTPPTAHVQFSNAVGDMHFSDVFQKGENILTKSMDKVLVSQIRVRRDQDQRDWGEIGNILSPRPECCPFLETKKWNLTEKIEKKSGKKYQNPRKSDIFYIFETETRPRLFLSWILRSSRYRDKTFRPISRPNIIQQSHLNQKSNANTPTLFELTFTSVLVLFTSGCSLWFGGL